MKNKITPDIKTQILIEALKERYRALHKIRERVQNTSYWTLGFLITASGWIIQTKPMSIPGKILVSLLISIGYTVIRHIYLTDLCKGFISQQKVAVRIEKALGLYNKFLFDKDNNSSIYPESWEKSGSKDGKGKYFATNFRMIDVGTVIILIALWFQGLI